MQARIRAAGFDASEEDLRHALVQRYAAELDPERLALAAAGALPDVLVDAVVTEDAVVYVEAGAVLGAAL